MSPRCSSARRGIIERTKCHFSVDNEEELGNDSSMKHCRIVFQGILVASLVGPPVFLASQTSGYRIETMWGAYDPEEVHFISAALGVVKRLSACAEEFADYGAGNTEIRTFSTTQVAKGGTHLLRVWESRLIDGSSRETLRDQNISVQVSYFSAAGKVLWQKEFEISAMPYRVGKPLYDYCIAPGGEVVAFFAVRQRTGGNIQTEMWVFNESGKERVHTRFEEVLEKPEISSDGRIIGAYMPDGMLLFFEVNTGRKKMVDARGDGWNGFFMLSPSHFPPASGKVRIGWRPLVLREHETLGKRILTKDVDFNALPVSLRTFFRGKK